MSAEQDSATPPPKGPRFSAEEARRQAAAARKKTEFILSRAYGLLRHTDAEWEQIRAEPANASALLLGYVAPLAALQPVCGVIGQLLFGQGFAGGPGRIVVDALMSFLATLAFIYLLSILINTLAENFDAERNDTLALKVASYSFTPFFLTGILWLWPQLWSISLIGIGVSAFLLYRGLMALMKAPAERIMGYCITVLISGFVAVILVFAVARCATDGARL
jgi:cation transporter-like permease